MKKMKFTIKISNLCGVVFALMPFLCIYSIGIPYLSLGQVLLFFFIGISYISGKRFKASFLLPFTIYVILITIMNLLFDSKVIVGDEIHDMLAWICFIVTLFGAISYADYQSFLKTIMIFGCISVAFFYLQFFLSLVGFRISGLIPILPLAVDVDVQSVVEKQVVSSRLCGLFMEPSHYAENMSLFLALVLLRGDKSLKTIIRGLIITITIFLSQSAMGVILVLFIWVWWFLKRYTFSLSSIIIIAAFVAVALPFVISSELKDQLMLRFSADYFSGESGEGHYSTYIRTIRGYIPFIESDILYKVLGHGLGSLSSYINANPGTGFLRLTALIPNWINGMSYLLLCTGVIGTFLYLKDVLKLYKKNSEIGKAVMVLVLLLLLSSDSLFLIFQYFYIAYMEKTLLRQSSLTFENKSVLKNTKLL